MRKYIVGFIVGLVMSVGITAFAEEINSMVGKVVQGTFPVFINGDLLDNEAIVIDGTSYLPVREVADRLGLEVEFELDKGVNLVSQSGKKPIEESNVVEEIDNTPEIAGLIITSTNNNINVTYSWFDDPVGSIDQGIRTVEYGDVILYSVNDFIEKFGNEMPSGKPFFAESENGYTINKENGITVSYVKSNKKQAQVISGELYFNIKSYPKLPGYPPPKTTVPTPITGNNEISQQGKLELTPNLNKDEPEKQILSVQEQLDLVNEEIARKEFILRQVDKYLETETSEEEREKVTEPYQKELSELEDLKRQKTELEQQLAP